MYFSRIAGLPIVSAMASKHKYRIEATTKQLQQQKRFMNSAREKWCLVDAANTARWLLHRTDGGNNFGHVVVIARADQQGITIIVKRTATYNLRQTVCRVWFIFSACGPSEVRTKVMTKGFASTVTAAGEWDVLNDNTGPSPSATRIWDQCKSLTPPSLMSCANGSRLHRNRGTTFIRP